MPHVFISYSRKDTDFVEKLEHDLNTRGIPTWRDKTSIVGSEDWYLSIVQGLENAYTVLLVVTPNSDESRWVRREALYADELGVHTIPVWPERYTARLYLHFLLIEKQPVYCDSDHYANGLAQLTAKLADLSKTTPATPPKLVPTTDRATELAYLDFVLSEMKAELRTARYVNLGATRESTVLRKSSSTALDEFEMSFDRFEPLVKAECLHGDDLDRTGEPVEDARDLLREMTRAILLGEPGSGKTTTLQQLAIDLARTAQQNPDAPLPVFVPLRSYAGGELFSEFVRQHLGPLQSQYERLLADGRLVLLCDALNEMQRTANGRDLMAEVRDCLRDRKPWIVSCRVRDYQDDLRDLPNVDKVRLKPLDLPRIKQVIDRRFHEKPERATALWADLKGSEGLLEAWQAFETVGIADNFWERPSRWGLPDEVEKQFPEMDYEIKWRSGDAWQEMHTDCRRMMQLCRNPFMLFMVCGTFERMGKLPPNRGALFANFVDNLLRREEANSRATNCPWIDARIIRRALAQLAAYAETDTEISRTEAERILEGQRDISDPPLLLRLAAAASLLDVGERICYTHQLLQEYFASEVLGEAMDEKHSPTEFWPREIWWERQGWEETAAILAGVRGDPEAVARWIAPAQPEVAYQVLTESGMEVNLDEIQPETRAALVEAANAKTAEANRVGRSAAYRVLGCLKADLRPGVGLRPDGVPDIAWSETIKSGKFQMGGDPSVLALFGKWDGAEYELKQPFWIARYLVTYAQYEAFVAAGGYQEQSYWTKTGWARKGDKTEPQYWKDPRWHISNHPVIGVTWNEACAFTRWLDELRKQGKLALPQEASQKVIIRLPTEAEWEKAARYPDGREFPWGNEPDTSRLNCSESDIGRTSAVGIFPTGASSTGGYDMGGNVWERCMSQWSRKYHFPEQNDAEGTPVRTLRGGSWYYSVRLARCATRFIFPDLRLYFIGFRVVCAPPL